MCYCIEYCYGGLSDRFVLIASAGPSSASSITRLHSFFLLEVIIFDHDVISVAVDRNGELSLGVFIRAITDSSHPLRERFGNHVRQSGG